MTLRVLFICLINVFWAVASHAGPTSLNVRPGLWEMTSTGQTTGAPPIPAEYLARLTPEQRAKFEAAMAATAARSSKPRTFKQCVTEKSLQHGFKPDDSTSPNSCKETVVSNTGTVMEVRIACTGRERRSGTFHFEASSPLAMAGTIDMTMTDGSHTMSVKRVMQGKWLSSDCGTLKGPGD